MSCSVGAGGELDLVAGLHGHAAEGRVDAEAAHLAGARQRVDDLDVECAIQPAVAVEQRHGLDPARLARGR